MRLFMHAPTRFRLGMDIRADALMETYHRGWQISKIQYLADHSSDERREAFLEALRVLRQKRRFTSTEMGVERKYRPPRRKLADQKIIEA